ncbi:hypothetical protein ACTFIU_011138 [Dictyostelium citrinum]
MYWVLLTKLLSCSLTFDSNLGDSTTLKPSSVKATIANKQFLSVTTSRSKTDAKSTSNSLLSQSTKQVSIFTAALAEAAKHKEGPNRKIDNIQSLPKKINFFPPRNHHHQQPKFQNHKLQIVNELPQLSLVYCYNKRRTFAESKNNNRNNNSRLSSNGYSSLLIKINLWIGDADRNIENSCYQFNHATTVQMSQIDVDTYHSKC